MTQIATTVSQSRRLLAAGVESASADMVYVATVPFWEDFDRFREETLLIGPDGPAFHWSFPAWSLSKLWDILSGTVLGGWFSLGSHTSEDVIEDLVTFFEERNANH